NQIDLTHEPASQRKLPLFGGEFQKRRKCDFARCTLDIVVRSGTEGSERSRHRRVQGPRARSHNSAFIVLEPVNLRFRKAGTNASTDSVGPERSWNGFPAACEVPRIRTAP